ncbi:hypothetical protein [Geodermatophilus sp. DSM 45219]|uniref:hypothetical protein n=1 Tax=Geodermatophilus sp. DSM 45219 TaxID=1881103 RepID=UPI0008871DFE|nr:hypothetical protein [Geodermatophilus sp. DSM 45219]SDN42733.1 hypothetical protein SAMN05428965_0349 [Geodermatophilus sp. DSM 45219]
MSREIPQAVRAAVGLAATVIDDARQLPHTLVALPVRVIGLAMQATMKVQQHYSGLVARGDEVFTGLRGEAEPGLATFDEDLPEPGAGRTSAFDRAPGFDRETPFDRATVAVDDEEIDEEAAALIDDEVSGLPADPAPEEVVEALADISDEVAAAGLDLDRAEPGLSTEDALETALLEADGAPDSALVDGGTGDTGTVDTDEIAESPTTPPPSLLDAEATEFDVHPSAPVPSDPGGSPVGEEAGAPDVTTEVDVLTPDGGVATVEGTVTDEGVAAPEAATEEPSGAPAADDTDATGSGDEVVTAAGAAVDDALGTGEDTSAPTATDDAVATDEGGTEVAAATGEQPSTAPAADDTDATGTGDEVVTAAGAAVDDALGAGEDTSAPVTADDTSTADGNGTDVAAATGVRTDVDESPTADEAADTTGAGAAGAAPVQGYDGFTIAQLRGRLRGYQLSTVQDLVAYEEATRGREPYLRMLRNRLEKLERQAVEDSPLAPRGA